MFRCVYWVTEFIAPNGASTIGGIYTSIPNLLHRGLNADSRPAGRLRLTLSALNSDEGTFGTWTEPHFGGLDEVLAQFVRTEEISAEHCQMLLAEISSSNRAASLK